jgi:leucyl aminopeptidase
MKIGIKATHLEKQQKTCLMLAIYEGGELTPTANEINRLSKGYINKLLQKGIFQAKIGQTLPVFQLAHTSFEHIILVGAGQSSALTPDQLHKITLAAVKSLNTNTDTDTKDVTCYLSELCVENKSLSWLVKYLTESIYQAYYRFDLFKSDKEPIHSVQNILIHLPDVTQQNECKLAVRQGTAISAGVTLAKNLANLPSNICTPYFLGEQAKELAKSYSSMSIKILEENDMSKLGMGELLAVSQGSAEQAKLICLEYKGTTKSKAPIMLVGKGVTFDTGGNSLKSPDAMVGMKYDMCGAATVLGTLKATAELKLPLHIVGIIPTVENMPGGSGYKPEDILTSLSGQTIEVISTDAEGRLILADALTYCERYHPDVVIDIATLTGAVVVALGHHVSALLSNNDQLANELLNAGNESNDKAWQLPLYEEYQAQIKSSFADMTNSGGRSAGAITAACFLSRFTKTFRWAHLDVAGTAAMMTGTADRYATGRPVPLLMQYLINRSS